MDKEKIFSRQLIGKAIIPNEKGRKLGEVKDVIFETKSGELIHMVLKKPTNHVDKISLERNKEGQFLIPFSSLVAIDDYVIISEEDII